MFNFNCFINLCFFVLVKQYFFFFMVKLIWYDNMCCNVYGTLNLKANLCFFVTFSYLLIVIFYDNNNIIISHCPFSSFLFVEQKKTIVIIILNHRNRPWFMNNRTKWQNILHFMEEKNDYNLFGLLNNGTHNIYPNLQTYKYDLLCV